MRSSIFHSSDDDDDDDYIKRFSGNSVRRSSIFFGGENEAEKMGRRNATPFWPDMAQLNFAEEPKEQRKKKFKQYFDNITCPGFDKSTNRSLFIFSKDNVIRMFCNFLIHNKLFEYFILFVILANCGVLAADEYLPFEDRTPRSVILAEADPYFLIIFTAEAVLKIIAKGFLLHKGAYLRSPWNILDFIIVVSGLLATISSVFNQPALRALRVLRPVKIVTGFESLHVVLKSIVCAMAPLLQIGFLVLFAVFIFAIIGLEFYCGALHMSCWNPETKEFDYTEDDNQVACSNSIGDNITSIIGAGFICPEGYVCKEGWEGPLSGLQNFDNIYLSFLTVFVVLTMAGWTDLQYRLDDALGRIFNWLYFVPIIIFGAFFMLNLVLGVLSCEFANERQRVEKRKEFLKLRRQKEVDVLVENYLEWILDAEETLLKEDRTSNETKMKIIEARRTSIFKKRRGSFKGQIMSDELQEKTLMERSTNCFSRMWRKQKLTRFKVRRILKSQIFFWLVIALVFINTALIATEHYGQPKWLDDLLTYSEYVFLTIFYLEMLLKMYGLGIRGYFKSMFNSFDFIVLLASTAEIVAQIFDSENSYGFSSLRATRLLRIFKITKYWQSLRNLSLSLINSIKSIMSLLFLLFLFMVIFALLGMQFFGGQFNFEDGRPKANFDTFFSSILTVFQILTGENWDEVLYNGMKALGGFNVKGFFASLYFLLLVVLGSYTLLNVFLAIAVDNLAKADELTSMEMAEEQRRKSLSACDVMEPNNESGYNNDGFEVEIIDMEKEMNEGKITPIIAQKNGGRVKGQNFLSINDQAIIATPRGSIEHEIHKRNSISKMYEEGHMRYKDTDNNNATKYFKKFFNKVKTINDQKKSKRYDDYSRNNNENSPGINRNNNNSNDDKSENPKYIDPNPILPYSSLFIFSSTNPIRKFAHFVVTFPYFDGFIITIILLSCVALAIADPVNYVSEINNVLDKIDLAFTAIFTMEAMLKILNLGLILHKGAYGRDLWNILDLFIVVTAITGIAFEGNGDNLQTIRSLRVLRVLRPLKTINRVAKLKAVFDGLIVAVTRVFVIMTLYILFQLIFAIIAVQLLLGNFFYCTDLSKITKEECRGEYLEFDRDDVTVNAREWKVYEFNFDNIFNSFLTLFVVQTRSGWPEIMKNAMDSSTRNHGPIPESNNAMSIFFIVYFIVFPFFFVNLFVALIVITFQEQGEKDLDELNMDKNQRNCLEFVLNSTPLDCYKPKTTNKIRIKIWKWIISPPFEYLMSTLILLNTITLMLKYYQQPVWYETMLNYFNIFFTVAFTIEFLIKLYGFGFKNYFRQGWNLFDLVTVLGSILDIIVFYAITNTKTLGFLKLFRAMRLLKLLRQSSSIRMLLWTFLQAIFALPYVLLLIWLLFYIYAVIGMQLFGTIQLDPQTAINRHSNFQNFINAIVLLFRCSTLDNWDTVLYACIYGQACDERSLAPNQPPQNTCGSDFSVAYYVSFNFITAFMMLNLFIAVIMDNFDYLTRDSSILGPHHLYDYIQKWATYDPTATGYIHYTKVYDLLRGLEPPVGFGKKCPIKLAYKKLIRMNMPLDDNDQVNFSTTMFALVRESLSIKVVSAEQMDQMDQELRQALASLFFLKPEQINKFVPLKEELAGTKMTVGKIYASLMLVDAWKSYKAAMNPTQQAPKEEKPNILNRFIRRMSHVFNRSNNESKSSSDDDDDDGHPSNKDYQENEAKKEKKIKASRKEVNPNKLGVPMRERRRRSIEEVNTNNNNNNDEDDEYDDSEGQAKILIEEKIKKMKKRKHSEKFKKRSGDRSYNETESKKIRKNEVNHNNNRISAYNDEDVQNRSHKYKSRNRTKCNSNYNKDYNIYDLENAETGDEDKIYNTHNYNNNKNKNYYINRNNNNNGNIHNNTSFTPYNNNIRNNNNNNNTNTNNNNNNNASTSYAHNNNFKNDNNTNNNNENNYNVNNNGNNNKNSLRNNNSNNKNNNNENDNNKNNNNNNNNNKNNNTDNNSSNNNDDKKTEEKPEEESQSSYNRLTNWVSYYYFDSVNKVRKMIGFEDDTQQMNSEKY